MLDALFENLVTLFRKRKNLTVMDLCEKLGISMNYYYQYRSSKYQYLKRERVEQIVEALELTKEEAAVLWTAAQLSNKKLEIGDINPSLSNVGMLFSIYECMKYLESVESCSSSLILGSTPTTSPTENPGWYVLDTGKEKILTYIKKQDDGPYLITYIKLQPKTNEPLVDTTEYPYWNYDDNDTISWYPLSFENIIMSPNLKHVSRVLEGDYEDA